MVFGKGRPKVSGNNSVEIPVHTPQMPKIINGKFFQPISPNEFINGATIEPTRAIVEHAPKQLFLTDVGKVSLE